MLFDVGLSDMDAGAIGGRTVDLFGVLSTS
jgi:hypothetical protein